MFLSPDFNLYRSRMLIELRSLPISRERLSALRKRVLICTLRLMPLRIVWYVSFLLHVLYSTL
jgi:hypothetical protein